MELDPVTGVVTWYKRCRCNREILPGIPYAQLLSPNRSRVFVIFILYFVDSGRYAYICYDTPRDRDD